MKIRYPNGKTAKVEDGKGKTGFLLQTVSGEYFFRIYSPDGGFKDYDLHHNDLEVTIKGEAGLYEKEDGRTYLDHAPETLDYRQINE